MSTLCEPSRRTNGGKIAAAAALLLLGLPACERETPADDALSLREIVQGVEGRDYSSIAEVSYEEGHWRIEASKGGSPVAVTVDPARGDVVAERPRDDDDDDDAPPAGSLPLSQILETLEREGYTNVTSVDFEDDKDPPRWEIDALKNGKPHEVDVNPATGEIIAFRPEDFDG